MRPEGPDRLAGAAAGAAVAAGDGGRGAYGVLERWAELT